MLENIKLYIYLQPIYQKELHKEMSGIAHSLVKFVKKYHQEGINANNQQAFKNGLDEIGKTLTKRVAMEESELYVLYTNK